MRIRELSAILSKIEKIESVVIDERRTDHYRYTIKYGNKVIMRTKFSFGSREKSGDEKNVAKDLHFRVDELVPYASCTISNEEYLESLRIKNILVHEKKVFSKR